jgi:Leucine-rich repeat (LRR) protein
MNDNYIYDILTSVDMITLHYILRINKKIHNLCSSESFWKLNLPHKSQINKNINFKQLYFCQLYGFHYEDYLHFYNNYKLINQKSDDMEIVHIFNNLCNLSTFLKVDSTQFWDVYNLDYISMISGSIEIIPKSIKILRNIVRIVLNYNCITSLPSTVSSLKNLVLISVCGNNISTIPAEIKYLANLKELILSDNKFVEFPKEICYLENLEILSLSYTYIRNIPAEISNLKYLSILNLSCNLLYCIPNEIKLLTNIKYIDMRQNNITHFPNELCRKFRNIIIIDRYL